MIKKVEAIIRKEKLSDVDGALKEVGVSGLTFFEVEGRGRAYDCLRTLKDTRHC